MNIVLFAHSLVSCWNHGNAHFLRGVVGELRARGHHVAVHEPVDGWSRNNLATDHGEAVLDRLMARYPSKTYDGGSDIEAAVDEADVVLVHEWTDPAIVAAIGRRRAAGARFVLLFHDTHHRAVSDPDAMRAYDLSGYDGVLAFGQTLADIYRRWGWGNRVHVWHEAADTALFCPPEHEGTRDGVVWIGNFGDGERTAELLAYLLEPARVERVRLDIHGVRYGDDALAALRLAGAHYHGWLPNDDAPATFARHLATVHIPRRFYVEALPGIPTIRVFEALACGIPLLSAPWSDSENLFRVGDDFLMARDPADMTRKLRDVTHDAALRQTVVANGLETIRTRHTCAHRAAALLDIIATIRAPALAEAS